MVNNIYEFLGQDRNPAKYRKGEEAYARKQF